MGGFSEIWCKESALILFYIKTSHSTTVDLKTSEAEDNSDSNTKPMKMEKKKNPSSMFQTGGEGAKEKKTKKKRRCPGNREGQCAC